MKRVVRDGESNRRGQFRTTFLLCPFVRALSMSCQATCPINPITTTPKHLLYFSQHTIIISILSFLIANIYIHTHIILLKLV